MTITTITLPSFNESRVLVNLRYSKFHKCRIFYNECFIGEVTGDQGLNSLFTDVSSVITDVSGGIPLGIILLPLYSQCKLEVN
jgi:hypothetical protein